MSPLAQKALADSEVDIAFNVKSAGGGEASGDCGLASGGGGACDDMRGAFYVVGRGKKAAALTLFAPMTALRTAEEALFNVTGSRKAARERLFGVRMTLWAFIRRWRRPVLRCGSC